MTGSVKVRVVTKINTIAYLSKYTQRCLDKHHLDDWTTKINNAPRTMGRCSYRQKCIYISKHCLKMPQSEIIDTILHEIAHALVGPYVASHGSEWLHKARDIGCSGKIYYKTSHYASQHN